MLEGSRLVLLSPTPSVESWWRADAQQAIRGDLEETSWPEVVTADTRGILRNHPLTLPLTRGIEDMTRRGRRVLLVVTRRAGREKHHYLNPVPIRLIHDRWIDKYTERRVSALSELKTALEERR